MKKQGIVIPHEHGGWSMVSVPFLIGMFAGHPQWMHLPLFLAWLFLYLMSYPLLQAMKRNSNREHLLRWAVIYGLLAGICLIPTLLSFPSLLTFGPFLLVLLLITLWHVTHKSERSLINNLCAIGIFSIGGAAAYLLSGGGWDNTMFMVVLFNFLYFTGTVFYVKSMFRERKNKSWILYSQIYHILILLVPFAVGYPWMALAYLFSTIRAFVYGGKLIPPIKIGIIEIIGSVLFLLVSIIIL
ncbi:YwiC-like family protein [Brevibacillus daliensis]|uniref:YwiC-like family protein n=1 Tax=Brevibacillus daliensis TaxID=2892995 RepID=UPI001E55E519|nr:YwiC-like family protein [Brevibacillus daliensis]